MASTLADDLRSLTPGLLLNDESIIITSLLHDICKATRYKMNDKGEYEKNFSDFPAGHGEKSVILLLQWGFPLTEEEMLAIRWHMGAWQIPMHNEEQQRDYVQVTEAYPLVTLIHTADTLASRIMECRKNIK